MPVNVFGYSSKNSENNINTSLIVQKPFLRTNYLEISDKENQYRSKIQRDPIFNQEACSKNYIDTLFNDTTLKKMTKILISMIKG